MASRVEVVNLLQQGNDDVPVMDGPSVADDEQDDNYRGIVDFVQAILEAEGVEGRLTVALVDEETMAGLNMRYRAANGPTDVLSFSYAAEEAEPVREEEYFPADFPDEDEEHGLPDLGEIAVCPSVVMRYASEEGENPAKRFAWSILHGVLHVLGYDHETDSGEMLLREQVLLRQLEPLVRTVCLPKIV